MAELPEGLESCNSKQRIFPLSWKEAYFRENFDEVKGGYVCPKCENLFRGLKGFQQLKADHIHPYSKGGLTSWDNLQLLCLKCNLEKSNHI